MPQPPTGSLVLSAMQPWQQQTSLHPAAYEAHLPCKKGRLFLGRKSLVVFNTQQAEMFFFGVSKRKNNCLTFSSHLYSLNLHHQLTTVGKSSNPHFPPNRNDFFTACHHAKKNRFSKISRKTRLCRMQFAAFQFATDCIGPFAAAFVAYPKPAGNPKAVHPKHIKGLI